MSTEKIEILIRQYNQHASSSLLIASDLFRYLWVENKEFQNSMKIKAIRYLTSKNLHGISIGEFDLFEGTNPTILKNYVNQFLLSIKNESI
jgi:hypothetical protein